MPEPAGIQPRQFGAGARGERDGAVGRAEDDVEGERRPREAVGEQRGGVGGCDGAEEGGGGEEEGGVEEVGRLPTRFEPVAADREDVGREAGGEEGGFVSRWARRKRCCGGFVGGVGHGWEEERKLFDERGCKCVGNRKNEGARKTTLSSQ